MFHGKMWHIRKCMTCNSTTISVNRISFSFCLFHCFFPLCSLALVRFPRSLNFFSRFGLYQIRIRIESKSVTEKLSTVGYARHHWCVLTSYPANVAHISVRCVTVLIPQMSYRAPGIDFPSFSLLIETQRNIRVWRLYVLCNVIAYLPFYFLPLSLSFAGLCESQLCQFTIVFT